MKRVLVVAIGLFITGFGVLAVMHTAQPKREIVESLVSQDTLVGLSKKDASGIDTTHLASGITPPTNKWFSGIGLQKEPKKVFPTPLSFLPTENSFTVDIPRVQTTEKSILADEANPVTFTIKDATYYRITRYDELSVDLTYYKTAQTPLATVTISSGSPYIYYAALNSSSLSVASSSSQVRATSFEISNSFATVYGEAHDGASFSRTETQMTATAPKDSLITFFALPGSLNPYQLKELSGNRLVGTKVDFKKADTTYETTISLSTSNGKPTLLGLLPHQIHTSNSLFTLATIYGEQRFVKNRDVTFSTPTTSARDTLDVTLLSRKDKELLTRQLRLDVNATQFTAEDTYFAGKQLYRAAQLLQLAKQLDQPEVADAIQQKLHNELATWLKADDGRVKKVFYYDTKIKGIVGQTVSFGSQEFNDHHFHYGYFIYAASILAKYDGEFKTQYEATVNLLVADIANIRNEDAFPLRRNFDPYFGHSWASGSSPFNDGNNQESISEAINAWTAVGLWAKETSNQSLSHEAEWMLSSEYQSALSYWLNYDTNKPPYSDSYTHSISPLNWGGKRDYATFFSAEPSALLGILLIPMNPTMMKLEETTARIPELLREARATPGPNAQFADYLLMLQSLVDPTSPLQDAQSLPDTAIDDANSRSYMYAWIMSATK